jgi:flagellar hook protein FlgE
MNMNLQSDGVVGTASGSFSAPIQIVDSLGSTHTLTVAFTKTAANQWNYDIGIPGADLTSGTPGTPTSLTTGTLTFDSNGVLIDPPAPGQVAVAIAGLTDGASDINLNWNLYDANNVPTMSQYAQPSALSATSQDGIAAAQITQVSLADGGAIIAHYSDGSQQIVGQLALATIANPESLISVGQNNFEIGADTSTPVVGAPGTGSRGAILGGALESSNVDIAQEFTSLIVYQRSYEANSKVISTLDQLTQVLLNIKQ